jgi:general secretion pathway protein I
MQMRQSVPPEGWAESGSTGGIQWSVSSALAMPADGQVAAIHRVQVDVGWFDGLRPRGFSLVSLRPEQTPRLPRGLK